MMTSEQRQAYIKALLEERHGYEIRGETARVAEVDAELRAMAYEAGTSLSRAEKRPRVRKGETR